MDKLPLMKEIMFRLALNHMDKLSESELREWLQVPSQKDEDTCRPGGFHGQAERIDLPEEGQG